MTPPEGAVAYTHNALGQRTSMTLPGARTVDYTYDPATADLAMIEDWSSAPGPMTFVYTDDGRLDEVRRPTVLNTPTEDIVSDYAYDTAGRMTGLSHHQDGTYLAEYGYTLDANGNRTQLDITGTAVANGYEAYTYDAMDRVDYARYVDGGTATFGYDQNGNRTTVSAGGITTTYGYDDLNQLTSIIDNAGTPLDLSLTYDLNGNRLAVTDDTTSTITRDYTWDWDNRLTETEVNGVATDYAYLGDDTRQSLTTGSATTDYLYDRMSGLPQVVDDGTNGYLHDVTGNLVGIDGTGEATYPLQDGLGSVRLSVDDTGSPIGTSEWDAWGNLRSSTGSGYGFGWAGEQYDASSDLTYLRARYYSAGTGQFLGRDTVQPNNGGTTGYNPYSYANGNPISFTDPSGHLAPLGDFGGGIAGAFLYLAYVFECFLFGSCRYQGEHGNHDDSELVKGGMSAAEWARMAIGYGLPWIGGWWPPEPRPERSCYELASGTYVCSDGLPDTGKGDRGGGPDKPLVPGKLPPEGTATVDELIGFARVVYPKLDAAGYKDARIILRGSRHSGVDKDGNPVRANSDWDIGIVSNKLFTTVKSTGVPLKGSPNTSGERTFPYSAKEMGEYGISGLPARWG